MIKIAFYVLKINTIKMWKIVDATLTTLGLILNYINEIF